MNVVSYSIFGNKEEYYKGIDIIVIAHEAIYKNLELWLYHDDSLIKHKYYPKLLKSQELGKIKLITFENDKALTRSMLWRMLPLFEKEVDWCFCRDIDSIPMPRDYAAITEAINSTADFHFIYDDSRHNPETIPIFGGAMGYRKSLFDDIFGFKTFEEFMRYSGNEDEWFKTYAHDEHYLRDKIWPKIISFSFQHLTKNQRPTENIHKFKYSINKELVKDRLDKVIYENGDLFAPNILRKGWDLDLSRRFYYKFGNQELVEIWK